MRIGLWLLAALAACLSPAAGAQGLIPIDFRLETAARSAPAPDASSEIWVIGERLRGSARGDAPPLHRLDERDVAAYGAGTVGELIEALAPQARGAGGAAPVVLVNGQRISGQSEIRELPAEAVERVDILPEEVALRYGYRADRRVVNLVLRPRFRAVTAEAAHAFSTDGGRRVWQADAGISRIGEEGRWNLHSRYRRAEALLEGERDLVGGLGRFRTLLPRSDQAAIGGSLTRELRPNLPATVTARLDASESESRIGSFPGRGDLPPLRRISQTRAANLGLAANGPLGAWQWTFTGSADLSSAETRTERPGPGSSRRADETGADLSLAEAQLLASGAILPLPAGELHATLKIEGGATAYSSRALIDGLAQSARLSRSRALGHASFHAPLAGTLATTFDIGLEALSDFRTLRQLGYGLRWAPDRRLSLNIHYQDEESAPTMHDLGDPPLLTPNVRLFDFSRGETVDVERIDGGNPLLLPERRRSLRLSLSLRPFATRNLAVTASYLRSRLVDPVGLLPAAGPEIEAAFPERFARAADGRLLRIDARPVNFARSEREQVRWGFVFSRALAAPAAPAVPLAAGDRPDLRELIGERDRSGRLHLSVHHSWRLGERLLIRRGLPALDLLGGSVGSRPRHEVELQSGYYRGGIGLRLNATWLSGREVTALSRPGGAGRLDYSSLFRADAQIFADLGEQPGLAARARWLRGTRLTLSVTNLFQARQRIRDESGATPLAFQPAYLDPEGRSVRLSLRKLF